MLEQYMLERLEALKGQGMLRAITPKAQNASEIEAGGERLINLSSNDYLGLGHDKALAAEFAETLRGGGVLFSSSGSPLLTGAHPSAAAAAQACEALFPEKKCLFFNSGFAANSGVISALGLIPGTVILADKLIHASVIDGMTSDKRIRALRFAHNDMESFESVLCRAEQDSEQVIAVTEAVFSMDGDRAPLKELAALKRRHPKLRLYVDEAHSFGVYGEGGRGLCASEGVLEDADFILCTCGKALGSEGAFLLCSDTARSYFINTVRSLIFSTAISPVAFLHIAFMLKRLPNEEARRRRLSSICARVHEAVAQAGFPALSQSQIIPCLTGTNEKALKAAEFFKARGLYAMPIRHPTVPKGKARLRISLNAALSDDEVSRLCKALLELKDQNQKA